MDDVVEILHADDLRDFPPLRKLRGTDVAQSEMTDEPLLLEFGKHGQRFFDGPFRWPHHPSNSEVDDIELVEPEVSQIVVNTVDQLLARKSMNPRLIFGTSRA